MKNLTSNWAVQARLRAVEKAAWWRGWLGRNDLIEQFGLSPAQATNDFRRYQELNPNALKYNLSSKRYVSSHNMTCVLHSPKLEEGLSSFLGEGEVSSAYLQLQGERLFEVKMPRKDCDLRVARHLVLAALRNFNVKILYYSLSRGEVRNKTIAPHAFGWGGEGWHVRAWDYEVKEYQDFVLSRIEKATWPKIEVEELPVDDLWLQEEILELQINPRLDMQKQRALELDYGITGDDTVKIPVRLAMKQYQLRMLGVEEGGDEANQDFCLIGGK